MGMRSYLDRVRPLGVRHNHPNSTEDDRQKSEYRTLTGTLLYLGQDVTTQACYVASILQQR